MISVRIRNDDFSFLVSFFFVLFPSKLIFGFKALFYTVYWGPFDTIIDDL